MTDNEQPPKYITNVDEGKLVDELQGLFPIAAEAAAAYLDARASLAGAVDRALLRHDDLSSLIGYCPLDVMTTNHRHHADFMGTVFSLGLPDLLLKVVPWVYRVYVKRGFSADYFPVELRAWSTAVADQLGREHAEPIGRVYAWMIDHHADMIALSQAGGPFAFGPLHGEAEELLQFVLKGDSWGALGLVAEKTKGPGGIQRLYLDLIQPVMYRVGTLWEECAVSVSQEHAASAVISRTMASAYQSMPFSDERKGRALVACASNELHELGSRVFSDLLEADGWHVTFLGADMPKEDFTMSAVQLKPDVLCISATMPYHLLTARAMIAAVREEDALRDTSVLVGGLAFGLAPSAARLVGADACAENAEQGVAVAQSLWAGETPSCH